MVFNNLKTAMLLLTASALFAVSCNVNDNMKKEFSAADGIAHNDAKNEKIYSEYLEKTADLNFKTNNTKQTHRYINNMATLLNGVVVESQMRPKIERSNTTQLAHDSIQIVKIMSLNALMTVKIPTENCDAFIDSVAKKMTEPELMQFKVNDLTRNFIAAKVYDKQNATNSSASTNANIYEQNRKVDYSTINLSFYEPAGITYSRELDVEKLAHAETAFAVLASDAFEKSVKSIRIFLLFVIRYWSVIAIISLVVFLFRKLIVRNKIMLPKYSSSQV